MMFPFFFANASTKLSDFACYCHLPTSRGVLHYESGRVSHQTGSYERLHRINSCMMQLRFKMLTQNPTCRGKCILNDQSTTYFAGGARSTYEAVSGGTVSKSSRVFQKSVICSSREIKSKTYG